MISGKDRSNIQVMALVSEEMAMIYSYSIGSKVLKLVANIGCANTFGSDSLKKMESGEMSVGPSLRGCDGYDKESDLIRKQINRFNGR